MPPAFSTFHLSSVFLSIFPGHFSLQLGDWDICLPTHREMFCLPPASLPGIAFRTLTNCKHYNLIFSLRWARYIYLSHFTEGETDTQNDSMIFPKNTELVTVAEERPIIQCSSH